MKKLILMLTICALFTSMASAQTNYLPTFQFGLKGGADYSMFPALDGLHNKGQVGYIGGFWARFGGKGLYFQPELYGISRNTFVTQTRNGILYRNNAKFVAADVPLLVGKKIGTSDFGVRFYTGPVVSLALSKRQDFLQTSLATHLNYKDENFAWTLGAGVDVNALSIDIRYEAGINGVSYGPSPPNSRTHLNLVNITLAYSLFSDNN